MTTNTQRIDEQAAEWAVRLHGNSTPQAEEDRQAFDEWLAADVRHPGALLRARAIWQDLDRLGALAAGRSGEPMESSQPIFFGRRRGAALAASIAIAVSASIWLACHDRSTVYTSDVGEVRRVR